MFLNVTSGRETEASAHSSSLEPDPEAISYFVCHLRMRNHFIFELCRSCCLIVNCLLLSSYSHFTVGSWARPGALPALCLALSLARSHSSLFSIPQVTMLSTLLTFPPPHKSASFLQFPVILSSCLHKPSQADFKASPRAFAHVSGFYYSSTSSGPKSASVKVESEKQNHFKRNKVILVGIRAY